MSGCDSGSSFKLEENPIEKNHIDTMNVKIDSTDQSINVFEGYENVKFKLDYYHSEGYSLGDRFWYEIIIIDSMLVLYFDCPSNDDWHYVHYHKSLILTDNDLESIGNKVNSAELYQKSEGFPHWSDWSGSGYGENRLFIESDELNIAGGMIYNCISYEGDDFETSMIRDVNESSTIGGEYLFVFKELEKLFDSLPYLLEDKNRHFP